MRILYVTPWVLGDAGANAADIFPRLGVQTPEIEKVIVADFPRNKFHIERRQGAEFLRLEWNRSWLRYGMRIARKAQQENVDVIHVFYRQQNAVLLIFIKMGLILLGSTAKILMDHRSVNLAKRWRRRRKMMLNAAMQLFADHMAGNPHAVETNHFHVHRPSHIIDLGYDHLPIGGTDKTAPNVVNVWFIGSLKPKNRKSQFLIDIFQRVTELTSAPNFREHRAVQIHVAGPTNAQQAEQLRNNPSVQYHGVFTRADLYRMLQIKPGLGLAYMNHEFHGFAPSLKFAEYAAMRFRILASDTPGLQTQAKRMNLHTIRFLPEQVDVWAHAILVEAEKYQGLEPVWRDADNWSYPSIYRRQVLDIYQDMCS